MLIPGYIISILTFPGVIIHELGHELFCYLTNTKVYEVCYFRFHENPGYVLHAKTNSFLKNFSICTGPLFLNSIISLIFFLIFNHIPIPYIKYFFFGLVYQ